MALVKLSGIAFDIRGSVQGTTFQRTQGGLCIKAKVTPVNKNSLSQNISRNFTNICQQEWLGLTNAQRRAWNMFASYNRILQKNFTGLYINGQQCFIKLNYYRLQYGHAIIQDPQFMKCERRSVEISIQKVGAILYLKADRNLISFQEFVILFISYPVPDTINHPGSRRKLLIFTTTTGMWINITTVYENLWGVVPDVGDNLFIKYSNADLFSGLFFPFVSKKETL